MQESLNTIIPVFLVLFIAALANILYFKYRRPISPRNQAVIGLSYTGLCLSLLACIIAASKYMEPEQTMFVTLTCSIPAFLSWDYLRTSRPPRRK